MTLEEFKAKLAQQPTDISFAETMAVVDANYNYTPTAFTNGNVRNDAGTNEGSCKLFAFAKLQKFDKSTTLTCFGDYYRKDVLENPDGNDHGNIRNFMQFSWDGVTFEGDALRAKN